MEHNKVCVMLSIYNGEKFLREQIDSIINQKDVDVTLLIRDDGSSDTSVSIIQEYKMKNIILVQEDNIGCENSFNRLVVMCKTDQYKYFAFADQDDVWFENKLSRAISILGDSKFPYLYCANQIITDSNLLENGLMIPESSFEYEVNRMQENFFLNRHGCTMVWNVALMDVLKKSAFRGEKYLSYHDKWLNLLARTVGKVYVDKEPMQLYRIHNSNASGLANGNLSRIMKGIKLYWIRKNNADLYAKDCLKIRKNYPNYSQYSNTSGLNFLLIVSEYSSSLRNKIKLIRTNQIKSYKGIEKIFWTVSILLGSY